MRDESIRLQSIGTFRFGGDWQMPAHAHEGHHEMIFLTRGQIAAQTQARKIVGGAGCALAYPQTVTHRECATGGQPLHLYCLTWKGPAPEPGAWPLLSADKQGRMAMLLRWMLEVSPAQDAPAQATLNALMQALLSEYAGGGRAVADERVARVKLHVQEHLSDTLRLEDLAGVACLSKFHFAAVFREATGVAPMDWVRRTRVEAARTLLLTSALPLCAIAPLVGFRDEFHLSRVFRRTLGVCPSGLRGRGAVRGRLPQPHDRGSP